MTQFISPVELIKNLSADFQSDWKLALADYNLHNTFNPVYGLKYSNETCNKIIAFIIYAYDYRSGWLDLRQDRTENKLRILDGLKIKRTDKIFSPIISNEVAKIQKVILDYLLLQPDWRWAMIFSYLDRYSKILRFANQISAESLDDEPAIEDEFDETGAKKKKKEPKKLDAEKVNKVEIQRSDFLMNATQLRKEADILIKEIKNEYANIDKVTSDEMGFELTDLSERRIEDWVEFIRDKNKRRDMATMP